MCTYTQAHVCTQARVCVHTHLHTTCPPLPSTLHSSHQCPACPGPVGPHTRLLSVITQGTAGPGEGVRGPSRSDATSPTPPHPQSVPIISHSRWLLKQGELQQMSGPKTSRTLRTKKLFREIYLFLFNDLLVICRQIPG